MDEKKPRKTDRRTLYTRMVIKEALLSLLAEKEYADITIADLRKYGKQFGVEYYAEKAIQYALNH